MKTLEERLWPKVLVTGCCWYWQGGGSRGYGRIRVRKDNRWVSAPVHRLVYELLVGVVSGDQVLDHLCRTKNCVNPDHLEPVSIGENVNRGKAYRPRKTHCKYGHDLRLYRKPHGTAFICGLCYPTGANRLEVSA
jgi:hypothetical protein